MIATARRRPPWAAGFSLLEMLVVLAILGLLVALVAPPMIRYLGRGKSDTARIDIGNIEVALDLFRLDIGRYPTQQEGLAAILVKPRDLENWQGPYSKQTKSMTDPWGRPYRYKIPGRHGDYDLYSLGADDAPGGTGEDRDITSW